MVSSSAVGSSWRTGESVTRVVCVGLRGGVEKGVGCLSSMSVCTLPVPRLRCVGVRNGMTAGRVGPVCSSGAGPSVPLRQVRDCGFPCGPVARRRPEVKCFGFKEYTKEGPQEAGTFNGIFRFVVEREHTGVERWKSYYPYAFVAGLDSGDVESLKACMVRVGPDDDIIVPEGHRFNCETLPALFRWCVRTQDVLRLALFHSYCCAQIRSSMGKVDDEAVKKAKRVADKVAVRMVDALGGYVFIRTFGVLRPLLKAVATFALATSNVGLRIPHSAKFASEFVLRHHSWYEDKRGHVVEWSVDAPICFDTDLRVDDANFMADLGVVIARRPAGPHYPTSRITVPTGHKFIPDDATFIPRFLWPALGGPERYLRPLAILSYLRMAAEKFIETPREGQTRVDGARFERLMRTCFLRALECDGGVSFVRRCLVRVMICLFMPGIPSQKHIPVDAPGYHWDVPMQSSQEAYDQRMAEGTWYVGYVRPSEEDKEENKEEDKEAGE